MSLIEAHFDLFSRTCPVDRFLISFLSTGAGLQLMMAPAKWVAVNVFGAAGDSWGIYVQSGTDKNTRLPGQARKASPQILCESAVCVIEDGPWRQLLLLGRLLISWKSRAFSMTHSLSSRRYLCPNSHLYIGILKCLNNWIPGSVSTHSHLLCFSVCYISQSPVDIRCFFFSFSCCVIKK